MKQQIISEARRVLNKGGLFLYADYSLNDEHWKLRRSTAKIILDKSPIFLESEESLKKKLESCGFTVKGVEYFRFFCEFELQRYVKSQKELNYIRSSYPELWKYIQQHMNSEKIEREFILLICKKTKVSI
jgi:ubiquinone/menaquinone biosynthesis C-methylase UbiE